MIPWTGTLWQEASSERTAAPTAPYGVARRTEPKMFGLAVRTDAAEVILYEHARKEIEGERLANARK